MGIQSTPLRPSGWPLRFLVRSPWKQHGLYIGIIAIIAPKLFRKSKKCSEGSNVSTAVLPPSLMVLKVLSGPHNLRSFLAANSTQNYFLIARMLSFLWQFVTIWDNFWCRKWIERKEKEKMRKCRESLSISSFSLHFLSLSSFSLHFLFIFSFSLHFLAAWLPGCHKLCNPLSCLLIRFSSASLDMWLWGTHMTKQETKFMNTTIIGQQNKPPKKKKHENAAKAWNYMIRKINLLILAYCINLSLNVRRPIVLRSHAWKRDNTRVYFWHRRCS